MNTQAIIQKQLARFLVPGRVYHAQLPPELAKWYCYLNDSGHNICIILKQDYSPLLTEEQLIGRLCPAPVKTVLRGYEVHGDFIVADIEYDPRLGLLPPPGDDEF